MKNLIFFLISAFCLLSCASSKINNDVNNSISKSDEGKITYELATGDKFLVLDTPNTLKFKFENIDTKTVSIIGRTIRIVKFAQEPSYDVTIELSPSESDLVDGKFKIIVNHKSNGVFKTMNLYIPTVKR